MKKKLILLILAFVMMFSVTSCGFSKTDAENTASEQKSELPSLDVPGVVIPGYYVEHDNFRFSLESAKQYKELKYGNDSQTAADGEMFLVLYFEVKNISEEEQNIDISNFYAYADGRNIQEETKLRVRPEGYSLLKGKIAPGETLNGYQCYQVYSDWEKLELTYMDRATSGSPVYEFLVTKEYLS